VSKVRGSGANNGDECLERAEGYCSVVESFDNVNTCRIQDPEMDIT
jgi:hypothetical protein